MVPGRTCGGPCGATTACSKWLLESCNLPYPGCTGTGSVIARYPGSWSSSTGPSSGSVVNTWPTSNTPIHHGASDRLVQIPYLHSHVTLTLPVPRLSHLHPSQPFPLTLLPLFLSSCPVSPFSLEWFIVSYRSSPSNPSCTNHKTCMATAQQV